MLLTTDGRQFQGRVPGVSIFNLKSQNGVPASSDNSVVQNDTSTGGPASSCNADPAPISVNEQSDFADFSSRSRFLGRVTSEQALDYFLDQHNSRSSQ